MASGLPGKRYFRSLKMISQTSVVNFRRFTEFRADVKKTTAYSLYEMNVIWRVNYMLQTNL
jgi:hypothetical protein